MKQTRIRNRGTARVPHRVGEVLNGTNLKVTKKKTAIVAAAESKTMKPVNSFLAFRSYYAPIFVGLQQKTISSFLTYLWQEDSAKAIWSVMAKAYSLIRDKKSKENAPLDAFLEKNAEFVGAINPEQYMSALGWQVAQGEDGGLVLRRQTDANVAGNLLTANTSVCDVISNSLKKDYITQVEHDEIVASEQKTVLTMVASAQPALEFTTAIMDTYGENCGAYESGIVNPVHPRSPIFASDFQLEGNWPHAQEFIPDKSTLEFDPTGSNLFDAHNVFEFDDNDAGNNGNTEQSPIDFDFFEWLNFDSH